MHAVVIVSIFTFPQVARCVKKRLSIHTDRTYHTKCKMVLPTVRIYAYTVKRLSSTGTIFQFYRSFLSMLFFL